MYTKDLIFKIKKEKGVLVEIPVQEVFTSCVLFIKQNTSESNEDLQNVIQNYPELISMKDSEQNGRTLLICAASVGNLEAAKFILELGVDINTTEDVMQQTALHVAAFYNHLEIANLLIKAGADVNRQDKHKQTALWIAAAENRLDILRAMTAVSKVGLEIENQNEYTPLHAAALNGHLQIVDYLVNAGVSIDRQGRNKITALHGATLYKHPDIATFLVNHGANTNVKDSFDQTPLFIATVNKELELVKLMVEKGADPYLQKNKDDSVLDVALDNRDIDLLNVLWNKESTKKLHHSIINNNKEQIECLLTEHEFTEQELSVLFLFSVNHYKFDIASILLDQKRGLQSKYERFRSPEQDLKIDEKNGVTREVLRTQIYDIYREYFKSKLVFFQGTPFENSSEVIIDAFSQMSELLCDVPACIALLKPLEDELGKALPQLSEIEPKEEMIIKDLRWPSTTPENYQPLDKKGILRKIVRSYLQKHGIETQNELYNFAGFVEPQTAKVLVKQGALFKEQFLLGNALTHGLYTHYIQWFLMARAIDTGRVTLQSGLSLKDLLQASVDIQTKDGDPAWSIIIDNVSSRTYVRALNKERIAATEKYGFFNTIPSRYRFSSIMELTSFLYTSPDLPLIRGYLLDSLYKNIGKIQSSLKDKLPANEKIKQNHAITGSALSFWAFNRFNIGLTHDDVDKHYKDRAKTQGELDKKTGIVTKPIPTNW